LGKPILYFLEPIHRTANKYVERTCRTRVDTYLRMELGYTPSYQHIRILRYMSKNYYSLLLHVMYYVCCKTYDNNISQGKRYYESRVRLAGGKLVEFYSTNK